MAQAAYIFVLLAGSSSGHCAETSSLHCSGGGAISCACATVAKAIRLGRDFC